GDAFRLGNLDLGEEAEIDVHRLERAGATIAFGLDMPAGDVADQGAESRGERRYDQAFATGLGRGHAAGNQPDGGTFYIALDAGDLAGKADAWIGFETHIGPEDLGRVDQRIAMQAAEAGELRVFEARDHAEDFSLDAVAHLGLEADHVPERAQGIVL